MRALFTACYALALVFHAFLRPVTPKLCAINGHFHKRRVFDRFSCLISFIFEEKELYLNDFSAFLLKLTILMRNSVCAVTLARYVIRKCRAFSFFS